MPVSLYKKPSVLEMQTNMKKAQLKWHDQCIACGNKNIHGLQLEFIVTEEGTVETEFPCDAMFKGYPEYVHGGIIATVLDAAMTNCMFAHGFTGLTGELKVRFYEPVETQTKARARAWLNHSCLRLFLFQSEIEQNGNVKVKASGKFLEKKDLTIG